MVEIEKSNIPILILAAGEAKRLKPLSNQIIKPLVPIAGTPLIIRILDIFIKNGFKNFIFVISKEEDPIKYEVENYRKQKDRENIIFKIDYSYQTEPLGMGDAILRAEDQIKKAIKDFDDNLPFFISASDIIFDENTPNLMFKSFIDYNPDFILSYIKSKDPLMAEGHGNIAIEKSKLAKKDKYIDVVKKIIEKPGVNSRISDLYSMPIYIFKCDLFDYLRKSEKSKRNEYELQDSIQRMISENKKGVGVNILPNLTDLPFSQIGKYHITYPKDVLLMNNRFLIQGNFKFKGEFPTIIEPVNSTSEVEVGDSVMLGPNVFLYENCKINSFSEITNSILLGNNTIGKNSEIKNSIIGTNVEIAANTKISNKLILKNESKKANDSLLIFDLDF
ncbi:MAG: sugar phosphate nucleotidyltransferase [Promethearchaeota archaeon]